MRYGSPAPSRLQTRLKIPERVGIDDFLTFQSDFVHIRFTTTEYDFEA